MREGDNVRRKLSAVLCEVFCRECLHGKAHVHDLRRVSVARGEVHEPALGDGEERLAVRQDIALYIVPRVIFPDGELFKPRHVDLDVEVPGVCEYRAVLHRLEVLSRNDAAAPCDGDEHVAHARRVLHRHDLVPVHDGFERADRVDLSDDDLCAQPLCAQRHALAAPAVAGDDNVFARDDEVRRAVYTVPHGLTRAVAVIKHVLAVGLVDHDHREAQLMVLRHDPEPVYAGGRLLAAADDAGDEPGVLCVHEVDKVAAVIDYDVGADLEHSAEAVFIFLHRAAVACEDLHAAVSERRSDVVLRRERV